MVNKCISLTENGSDTGRSHLRQAKDMVKVELEYQNESIDAVTVTLSVFREQCEHVKKEKSNLPADSRRNTEAQGGKWEKKVNKKEMAINNNIREYEDKMEALKNEKKRYKDHCKNTLES